MRIAVLSDVHANLRALEAVLADVEAGGFDGVWCLGDLVGYGPKPNECAALLQERLGADGLKVATASSGWRALAALEAGDVDAVVSDLRMPDMDGAALWRAVSTRHPPLARRMLFVTGDTLSPDASRFLAEAGGRSLDKPFSKEELLAKVGTMLG